MVQANIKESKRMFDETKKEYEIAAQKSKAQEEALRQVNQKQADRAMDVSLLYASTSKHDLKLKNILWPKIYMNFVIY